MEKPVQIEQMKAGSRIKESGYTYFLPDPVNRQWGYDDPVLGTLLEKASLKLGALNSYARLVPNVDLFIQLHVTKEAVISSRIEGTQTTMEEALLPFEELTEESKDDWQEVNNYMAAMNHCIVELPRLPLSSRMLRQAHGILMKGVRGQNKQPGQFRKSQNWIGGASLADAVFIPPSHVYVNNLMGDLEKFLHNDQVQVPSLIRAAIAHYQFETIHPFLDGNGRIGRLLITLYLVSEGILNKPLLYLSSFFDENRQLYYDNLTRVREKNDLIRWVKYFLVGVEKTASHGVAVLENILEMKSANDDIIRSSFGRRTGNGLKLHEELLRLPIVNTAMVRDFCKLSTKAATDLISNFVQAKILEEITGKGRNRIFRYTKYLDLFK